MLQETEPQSAKPQRRRLWATRISGSCLCLLLWACQTYNPRQQQKIDDLLRSGQFPEAAERHRAYQRSYDDELLFQLNQSSLEYYASLVGQTLPLKSLAFERAEDLLRLQDSQQNSFAIQASSGPNKAYPATLQESLWHNVFASLYYWNRQSLEGALVEMRRSHEKVAVYEQYALQSRPENSKDELLDFRNSALMQYLGMIYYRAARRWDDWRISRETLQRLTQNTSYYPEAIPEPYIPERGLNRINFVVFSGTGVRKYAEGIRILKIPGGVAVEMQNGEDAKEELGFDTILLPSLSKNFSYYEIMIPAMREQQSLVNRVIVRLNKGRERELYPLENFSQIHSEVFHRLRADFLPKQIGSFIVKVVASELLQGAASSIEGGQTGIFGLLSGLIGSALVSGTSPKPDLRTAAFYPSQSWVGELQGNSGPNEVELFYYFGSKLLYQKVIQIEASPQGGYIVQDYYAG